MEQSQYTKSQPLYYMNRTTPPTTFLSFHVSLKNTSDSHLHFCLFQFLSTNVDFFIHWVKTWVGQLWLPSDSVSRSSRKEHEDYRKGKIPLGAAFYFQFVFICPPAPLGCLWERVSTCFIGRYCVSGNKSVLLTGASRGQVWVFHNFLYQVGIIWLWMGLFASLCVHVGCVRVCDKR